MDAKQPSPDTKLTLGICRPIGLREYRKVSKVWFPFLPMVDYLAIATLFLLLANQFIFTPGISVSLPYSDAADQSGLTSMGVLTILSIGGSEKVLFGGHMHSLQDPALLKSLQDFDRRFAPAPSYLLVKMGKQTPNQTLHDLSAIAREAGVDLLHIASDPR
jgi:biopolymer transport protein ExbD